MKKTRMQTGNIYRSNVFGKFSVSQLVDTVTGFSGATNLTERGETHGQSGNGVSQALATCQLLVYGSYLNFTEIIKT